MFPKSKKWFDKYWARVAMIAFKMLLFISIIHFFRLSLVSILEGKVAMSPETIAFWFSAAIAPIAFLPIRGLLFATPTYDERSMDLRLRINELKNTVDRMKADSGYLNVERFPICNDKIKYLMACVDKFVDEAQQVLSTRAHAFYVFGTCAILGAIGILHYVGILAYDAFHQYDMLLEPRHNATQYIVIRIFTSLAFAAAIYAIVKTLIYYGSSFFHEGTRLLDRRHALRFGRLYMYLKGSDYDFVELEGAFQWHMESQTIFQNISATKITDNTFNQLIKSMSDLAGAVSKLKTTGSSSPREE